MIHTQKIGIAVIAMVVLFTISCSGNRNLTKNNQQNEEVMPITEELPGVSINQEEPETDQSRITQEMEKELFDLFYEEYSQRYNKMVNEYMSAQFYLSNRNFDRARIAAIRAASEVPSVQIYEFLILILNRLNDRQLDEWLFKLEELKRLQAEGKQVSSQGEILDVN